MKHYFVFFVKGKAKALARAKATSINGHVRMYDTKSNSDYKAYIKLCASKKAEEEGLTLPIVPNEKGFSVKVYVKKAIPSSWTKKKKALAEFGYSKPTSKPDADNYLKMALDGLNELGFWKDDSWVTSAFVDKYFSEEEGMTIEIDWEDADE